jgi:RNA polymerase sigma-70 factor (ECF subfamily)
MNAIMSQHLEQTISDQELMLAAGRGDLSAFEQIVLRYQTLAWNAAYRFLGDRIEAEDVVQEAFLRIYTAARRYQATALFRTYLYRVLARICLDHVSKKKPQYASQLPAVAGKAPTPLRSLTDAERDQAVHQALSKLPPHQRLAVVLKYFDNLSYAEIAKAMGATAKAVERLLSRARQKLQKDLLAFLE